MGNRDRDIVSPSHGGDMVTLTVTFNLKPNYTTQGGSKTPLYKAS